MAKAPAITNRMLLQHIQGMRTALETRIGHIEKRMNSLETSMKEGFSENDRRIKSVDNALQRLFTHRVSMLGRIEALEEVVGINK